jgi:HipA-like protein
MTLRVWHDGRDVGLLSANERSLRFAYADAWRSDAQAFALSPRLPMTSSEHEGDEVLHFFANLLPEGPVLDTLCRLRRLPRGDVFRLLASFGREGAGAFDVLAEDESPDQAFGHVPYDADMIRADLAEMRRDVPLLHRHGELRLSLAGAQNKLPVALIDGRLHLPVGAAASTHILKPAPARRLRPFGRERGSVHAPGRRRRHTDGFGADLEGSGTDAPGRTLRPRRLRRAGHAPAPTRFLPARRRAPGPEVRIGRRSGIREPVCAGRCTRHSARARPTATRRLAGLQLPDRQRRCAWQEAAATRWC